MVATDAEAQIETQGIWRDETAIQSGVDSNRSTGTGRTSIKVGSESFTTDRDDREGRNFINECGQATVGGIVDQLIVKVTKEIEDFESRIADRREYLNELRELSQQLHQASEIH